jgi:uncharacterized protein (DUF427 family)
MQAIWKDKVIADSDATIVIEGNHYFPPESVNRNYLEESNLRTTCHWKGDASYCNIIVNGEKNEDAAWYYPYPSEAAQNIKNYVAFWKGVEVK